MRYTAVLDINVRYASGRKAAELASKGEIFPPLFVDERDESKLLVKAPLSQSVLI